MEKIKKILGIRFVCIKFCDFIRKIYENQILSVGEIQDLLNISQPVISLHLGILKKNGIINSSKEGKKSLYFIQKKSVTQVIQILYYDSI